MSAFSAGTNLLTRYTLLPMEISRLDEVMAIEEVSYTNPWTRRGFEYEIGGNPVSWPRILVTNEPPVTVVGYSVVWFVVEHLQIQNVAVHPAHRRQGLGRFLVRSALEEGIARGAQSALLEVRGSNAAAQSLYRALGFHEIGVRRSYYSKPLEDALLLQYEFSRE